MIPFSAYPKQTLREMFDGREVSPILPYESLHDDKQVIEQIAEGNGRISISGVQPKYSLAEDNGMLRLTQKGERGRYILKPIPEASFLLDRQYCPINEHLTMQIAKQAYHIPTAANCLCFFKDGSAAYLTRRFDVASDGEKYQQEDFASIAGISKHTHGENYKYDALSYEEFADIIDANATAAMIQKLLFFRVVVFNYLTLNDDAHLKNFSLISYRNNEYVMTPAYDLINTSLHLAHPTIFAVTRGLFKEGMPKGDVYRVDGSSFLEFGMRIGLNRNIVTRELNEFGKPNSLVMQLISESALSDALKEHYCKSFDYRRVSLTWK